MNSDFLDLIRAFIAADVRFLVVGAHALAAHGRPRATGDLDVWIDATPSNASIAYTALRTFGAALFDLTPGDLATPEIVFQIGQVPSRIDILTSISGVSFSEAWPERVVHAIEGVPIPFIGREAFIRNKRATGRHKDLGDIEALEGPN